MMYKPSLIGLGLGWLLFLLSDDNRKGGVVAYEPTWESLDARPLPDWYPNAKIGIFIHWGVFSVPAYETEWFWKKWDEGSPDFTRFVNATENVHRFAYPDYAHRFDATLYQPDKWAKLFAEAGAQYVVLTSKHHEGFTMWNSKDVPATWNWNVMDTGPRRDVFGDLAKAVRQVTSPQTSKVLKFGAYHSLFEWFHPAFLHDQANNFTTSTFVDMKTMPELYDLIEKYQVEVIWSDGDGHAPDTYWKSREFLAWLATNSSVKDTVVWNDRWGQGTSCHHGSFWNCRDRYQPNETMGHYFESCMTLDKHSWGANRKSASIDYLTLHEILKTLIQTISHNGNLLLNVGPSADGTINPLMQDRLLEMGKWLTVNGEAVYNTRSWSKECTEPGKDQTIYYTQSVNGNELYVFVLKWEPVVHLTCVHSASAVVRMLGIPTNSSLPQPKIVETDDSGISIEMPLLSPDMVPCQHAWVLALQGYDDEEVPPSSRIESIRRPDGTQHDQNY